MVNCQWPVTSKQVSGFRSQSSVFISHFEVLAASGRERTPRFSGESDPIVSEYFHYDEMREITSNVERKYFWGEAELAELVRHRVCGPAGR